MRMGRKLIIGIIWILAGVLLVAALVVGYLSLTEYKPTDMELLPIKEGARKEQPKLGKRMNMITWNIGYAGLGRNQNFFMDGGEMVRPDKKEDVEENLAGIVRTLSQQKADIYLLQEVDLNSHRSYSLNQREALERGMLMSSSFAHNYLCDFVPFPWPMIGKVESGLMSMSGLLVTEAMRESLPVPFSWPMRVANLKRCLLVERVPIEGTEKELVMINLHLEAYDDGAGKMAQTEILMQILKTEYRNGNYVIAGGDFNQVFPGANKYPILNEDYWMPGVLTVQDLPEGFAYVFDASSPTCRLLNENYSGNRETTQFYVIDGFILSPNIRVNNVETIDLNFQHSDHNPVKLEFTLMEE